MVDRPLNVLFLCTGNSARSILAEALLNRDGKGRIRAYSAGSFPKGDVHPMALKLIAEMGLPREGYRSKSWDEFAKPGAPPIDFVITVCDNAAGEICPVWPGQPMTAHWGIEDPAAVEGEEQEQAFRTAMQYLHNRIRLFLALPFEALDQLSLKRRLKEIGSSEGATTLSHLPRQGESIA